MRLGPSVGAGPRPKSPAGSWLPSVSVVRVELLRDQDLHNLILDEVERAFWKAVADGEIWDGHGRQWIARVTIRTTVRRARVRARELLHTLQPRTDCTDSSGDSNEIDPVDGLESTGNTEDLAARREVLLRFRATVAVLSSADQQLLAAKLEESYGDLAAAWRTTPGALRKRACLLWRRVMAVVLREE